MVHEMLRNLTDPSGLGNFSMISPQLPNVSSSPNATANATAEELSELTGALSALTNSSVDGPIVIKHLNVRLKKQNGIQVNMGAGVNFLNNMSGSLHDNNKALSRNGSVLRFNGAYDNNALIGNGSVLRSDGAFDNNAV